MGHARGIAAVGAAAFVAACGPTLVDGPSAEGTGSSASISASGSADDGDTSGAGADDGSASASVSASASASVTATETATDTATLTATETATLTATDTATLDDSGTGGDSTSAVSMVGCQDDGTIAWLVEVYVEMPIDGCVPPPDIDPSSLLVVGVDDWNGEAGSYEVGDEAMASYELEPLTGSIDLQVSSPWHPSRLDYELAGTTTKLTGSIDLETCSYVDEPPCEADTSG